MPIYEYVCNDCQNRYEKLVMSNGAPIACPKCASKKQTLQFSTFSTTGNGSPAASSKDSSSSFTGSACGCNPRGCGCH